MMDKMWDITLKLFWNAYFYRMVQLSPPHHVLLP